MRLPRDLSGADLARHLEGGEHHVTVPDHSPLRIGTLSAILSDIAAHFQISREEVIRGIFN
jgi:hypothetical protein